MWKCGSRNIYAVIENARASSKRSGNVLYESDDYFVPEKCQKLKGAQKEQDLAQTRADQI